MAMFSRIGGLALMLGLLLALSNTARAGCDLEIEITNLEVTKVLGDDPDVFVRISVLRAEEFAYARKSTQTEVVDDQQVGGRPHQGETIWIPHVEPIDIRWWVYDDDWWFDDVMTKGLAELPMEICICEEGASHTVSSDGSSVDPGGPEAQITLKITAHVSECGSNINCMSRDLPYNVPPNTSATVTLDLHIDETSTPGLVTLTEQIPGAFTFQSAVPVPSSVNTYTDDDGLSKTVVTWEFFPPPLGDHMITYDIVTPVSEDQYCALFHSQIEVDGNVYYSQILGTDRSMGPGEDCDLNGIPDACQIAMWPSEDLNGNGILDVCEGEGDIPTLSEWGLIILVVSVGFVTWALLRRRKAGVSYQ